METTQPCMGGVGGVLADYVKGLWKENSGQEIRDIHTNSKNEET